MSREHRDVRDRPRAREPWLCGVQTYGDGVNDDITWSYGATEQEVMEAIWVAAEMRAGAAYAHSLLALETMNRHEAVHPGG